MRSESKSTYPHRHYHLSAAWGVSQVMFHRWRLARAARLQHGFEELLPQLSAPALVLAKVLFAPKRTPTPSSRMHPTARTSRLCPRAARKRCRSSRHQHSKPVLTDLFVFYTSKVPDSWSSSHSSARMETLDHFEWCAGSYLKRRQ